MMCVGVMIIEDTHAGKCIFKIPSQIPKYTHTTTPTESHTAIAYLS